MDKETNQQIPSLLPNNNTTSILEDSTRKPGGGASGGVGGSDRSKRDEWSEGAVSCLLEAYESKWIFRNRAKLKGHDWEDVASFVSSRANSTKSSKTQTQCKNKIESMKKRYRSESATADTSSWPLYPRLDNLLRGTCQPPPAVPPPPSPPPPPPPPPDHDLPPPFMLLEPSPSPTQAPPPPAPPAPAPPALGLTQHSHGSNGVDRMAKEDGDGTRSEHLSDKKVIESDSSTPVLAYSDKDKKWRSKKYLKTKMEKKKRRKRSSDNQDQMEIAESIRWVAEVVVRSEQARMEMMRDIERMRIEAEAKRGEIDLKQTEIIANTQLEIARLFATSIGKTGTGPGGGAGGSVDSSLRIGRC